MYELSSCTPIARARLIRTVHSMDTSNPLPELAAFDRSTGQPLSWADAVKAVYSGLTSPEALELQVIWPTLLCDIPVQNTNGVW